MICPICKKSFADPGPGEPLPPDFPFCSDRCKLVDLNRWLTGRYQVPVVDREDPDDIEPTDEALG
jgi:endogenous inhibitor of DNA gyrase (YacG/DUF329 family)